MYIRSSQSTCHLDILLFTPLVVFLCFPFVFILCLPFDGRRCCLAPSLSLCLMSIVSVFFFRLSIFSPLFWSWDPRLSVTQEPTTFPGFGILCLSVPGALAWTVRFTCSSCPRLGSTRGSHFVTEGEDFTRMHQDKCSIIATDPADLFLIRLSRY